MSEVAARFVQLPFNYVVDFSAGPTAGPMAGPIPVVDTPAVVPGDNVLGPMTFGGDGNDLGGETVYVDGGLLVTVKSSLNGEASRTAYVVSETIIRPKPIPAIIPSKFSEATYLVAELEFDSPSCVLPDGGPSGKVWAVGLNFKTGNAHDVDTELRIGPTCNFGDQGRVNFNGTSYSVKPAYDGTYAEYAQFGTKFLLRASLYRTATDVAANASLTISGLPAVRKFRPAINRNVGETATAPAIADQAQTPYTGSITPGPNAIIENLTDAAIDHQKITAVGFSVHTNPSEAPEAGLSGTVSVSARLLSFSLYYK